MNYRQRNELIVKDPISPTATTTGRYIHANLKQRAYGRLNANLTTEVRDNDIVLRWKDRWSHTVSDVFNYCPMILNYLSMKGYEKILFVGHFNAGQQSWTINRKTDRIIHPTPTYHSTSDTMVDPNVWLQFLPIVRMAYGYTNMQMHTLSPKLSRHRGVMNALYRRYECDLLNCDVQYKKGVQQVNIDRLPDTQYDCVVLAGVPKLTDDTLLTYQDIKSVFAGYCKQRFDLVDLRYERTPLQGGVPESNDMYLTDLFAIRSIWDQRFREEDPADKQIQYAILNDIIKCYPGRLS